MNLELLNSALKNSPVSNWRAFDEIGSTNDEALRWLDEGATDFSLVIADSQNKGRGRFDRKWVTRPGTSLAFTVIFKPTPEESKVPTPLYAPMCGLAVWQALHDKLGLNPQIKWPNDVLLEREKCCGILVEAAWTGTTLNGIIAGIGINIAEGSLPPAGTALFLATWIEQHTGKPVDRFALLSDVLVSLADWRSQLGTAQFYDTWQEHLAFKGERVRVEQAGNEPLLGTEMGIDSNGNLLLLDASGATITVEVGDVHLRSAEPGEPITGRL
jgi:BirA family biotin operon repressor/biotin-[acetyl-CoA-carboxylase] ligase